MKNPFKKSAIVDTLVNVGVGGAANAVFDAGAALISQYASLEDTTKNAVKIALGAIAGSMISGNKTWHKVGRAAADGIATVGVSELVKPYAEQLASKVSGDEGTAGLPEGTIGKIRLGQRGFARRARRVAGVAGASFMEA